MGWVLSQHFGLNISVDSGLQDFPQRGHQPAEILPVAGVARDQMQVEMEHALSGGGAAIHQQLESVGMVFLLQELAQLKAETVQGSGFGGAKLKEIASVAARNDEAMSWRDGANVADGDKMFVFQQDLFGFDGAEGAFHIACVLVNHNVFSRLADRDSLAEAGRSVKGKIRLDRRGRGFYTGLEGRLHSLKAAQPSQNPNWED